MANFKYQAQGLVFTGYAADPTGENGLILYRTDTGKFRVYASGAYQSLAFEANHVLKSGDSMTGALTMNAQNEVRFADADSSNYVAIKGAATIGSNYSIVLPASAPTASTSLTYDGANYVWADAGTGTVNAGVAGKLALYPSSASAVDDVYVQNSQNIDVAVVAQPTRSAAITYTIPNPGDAVAAASFVLTEGAQTINGVKTFGNNVIITGNLNVNGTTTTINTANLVVTDKNIVLNNGGAAASAGGAGLDFEENAIVTGYVKVSSDRASLDIKAPANDGIFKLSTTAFDTQLLSASSASRVLTLPDATGTLALNTLANLGSTAANASIIADSNNTKDLGSDAIEWKDLYVHSIKHGDATNPDLAIQTSSNNGKVVVTAHGTGSFDVKADKMRLSESGASSNYIETEYFHSISLADNTVSGVISALTVAHASYEGITLEYVVKEATTGKVRKGTFSVVTNGSAIDKMDEFHHTADLGLSLSAVINGSNIEIQYTTTSTGNIRTMRVEVKRFTV